MQEPFTPLSSVHHAPQVQHRGECGANNIEVCILHQPRATNQLHAVDFDAYDPLAGRFSPH